MIMQSESETNYSLGISLGDTFSSLEEVEKTIADKSREKFIQMFRRDSVSIQSAVHKKGVKRNLKHSLKFYRMKYCCIHGGQKCISRGKGVRNKSTFRKASLCPAHIIFTISKDGDKFEVTDINNAHNHKVVEALYKRLPHNRKLPNDVQRDTLKLLRLKANKHLIRKEIESRTNKCITLKDISNLKQKDRVTYSNSVKSACEKINKKYGADCYLFIDKENIFKGLMFCTKSMQMTIATYPEFICIDATFKLLQIRTPVYIILVEDGNGESQIVAVGILVTEDEDSITWFLESFKEVNPSWTKIQNIMADKDWNERDLLKTCFPQAQLHICIFLVFRIFQREITCEKMKITSVEKFKTLEFLQKLVYSRSENEFTKIQTEMDKILSSSTLNYLKENWMSIKNEWCPKLGEKVCNFLNTTNNRLEGINSIEAVISKHSTLEEFLDNLFVTIESLDKEKSNRVANFLNKQPVIPYLTHQTEYKYKEYLTDYAFKKMLLQITKVDKVEFISTDDNEKFYITIKNEEKNDELVYTCTSTTCTCYFFNSMALPCKHILRIRQHLNMDMFAKDIIHNRWSLKYFLENQPLFLENTEDLNCGNNTHVNVANEKQLKRPLTQQEKFKKSYIKM